jgi:hypothetical protein
LEDTKNNDETLRRKRIRIVIAGRIAVLVVFIASSLFVISSLLLDDNTTDAGGTITTAGAVACAAFSILKFVKKEHTACSIPRVFWYIFNL